VSGLRGGHCLGNTRALDIREASPPDGCVSAFCFEHPKEANVLDVGRLGEKLAGKKM